MRYFLMLTCLVPVAVVSLRLNAQEPTPKAEPLLKATSVLRALPKVFSRTAILKMKIKDAGANATDPEAVCMRLFVNDLISTKEKKANAELQVLMKKIKTEEDERIAADRERRRRQENYDLSWGSLARNSDSGSKAATHVKLEFQVLEIETYRRAAEACSKFEALSKDVIETLPKLDRDGDGRLTLDEYRNAGAIVIGSSRLFQSLDSQGDGLISDADLEAAKDIPVGALAAAKMGYLAVSAERFKLKNFDANEDGILDINERKNLTMSFVDASLRWKEEAAFYTRLAESLSVSKQVVAAKFADIEISR